MHSFTEREELQAQIIKDIASAFGNHVILKGGGALRFVFGSPRKVKILTMM